MPLLMKRISGINLFRKVCRVPRITTMVNYCVACYHLDKTNRSGLSFHKFPQDPELRQRWLAALNRDNFVPTPRSTICSKHFTKDCLEVHMPSGITKLRLGSVPTLCFDGTPPKPRKRTMKISCVGTKSFNVMQDGSIEPLDEPNAPVVSTKDNGCLQPTRQKIKQRLRISDLKYVDLSTPKKARAFRCAVKAFIKKKQTELASSREQVELLERKVMALNSVVSYMKEKNLKNQTPATNASCSSSGAPNEAYRKILDKYGKAYPETLKSFAITLNHYSPKAYEYVRETLENVLPHPRTVRKWSKSADGSPGLSGEASEALKDKVVLETSIDRCTKDGVDRE